MKISIIGYGKMGRMIAAEAKHQGHEIACLIDVLNPEAFKSEAFRNCDCAIEFSTPQAAPANILQCLQSGVPVVSGSTGWQEQFDAVVNQCTQLNGAFFYASNYSIGMNLVFWLNRQLARQMNAYQNYKPHIHEVHHTQKLDAPSGTARSLANDMRNLIENMQNQPADAYITSERIGDVVGEHNVSYESDYEKFGLKHEAFRREAFAVGAIRAAEFLSTRKGIYGMHDLLNLKG